MTLKSFSFFVLALSGFGTFSQLAMAQSTVQDPPANVPPASFTGSQFVDNTGCVYVRAGFDGAVTWVPRVSRQREHLCGQTPTFGSETAIAPDAPDAPVPTTSKPVQITSTPPVTVTPPVRTQTTTSKRTVVRASKPVTAETPRIVRPMPTVVIETVPHSTIIPQGHALGSVKKGYYDTTELEDGGASLTPHTRIVPKHVLEQNDPVVAHVPWGYRPAWEDDRLNSHRAWQTVKGHQDTQKVWTNTVPRRLVVQARRHEVKPPVVVGRTKSPVRRKPIMTTRSHPPKAMPNPSAKDARWIEIGAFTTSQKAKAAAHRLQSAGLTVLMAKRKDMSVLRVGPYATDEQLKLALHRVHGTGYTDAYIP